MNIPSDARSPHYAVPDPDGLVTLRQLTSALSLALRRGGSISWGAWPDEFKCHAAPAVELLEQNPKVKVVWAIASEMWLTYHKLSISIPLQGCVGLFSGNYAPAP